MRRSKIKTLIILLTSWTMIFGLLAPIMAQAATTLPYFKVYNGDIFSGGWFDNGGTACTNDAASPTGHYQSPTYDSSDSPSTNLYKGGILAYNKNDTSGNPIGAGTDFGAIALGLIEGNAASQYGFSSGFKVANSKVLDLANMTRVAPNYWGGFLEGKVAQRHCIPDYYAKQSSPKPYPGSFSAMGSKQYLADSSDYAGLLTLTLNSQTLNLSQHTTLFVKGDVYIDGNITYATGHKVFQTPQFALVVKGNIFIGRHVSQLDGLYIAQPDLTNDTTISTTGTFWDCHRQNNNQTMTQSDVFSICNGTLVINGAIIAKQVYLLHTAGDLSKATFGEGQTVKDSSGNKTPNPNIAEIINYSPDLVTGGPFFNQATSSSLKIQSIVSLPPVF